LTLINNGPNDPSRRCFSNLYAFINPPHKMNTPPCVQEVLSVKL
jgi:hypothetical protein